MHNHSNCNIQRHRTINFIESPQVKADSLEEDASCRRVQISGKTSTSLEGYCQWLARLARASAR
jgi:hypothetical protein